MTAAEEQFEATIDSIVKQVANENKPKKRRDPRIYTGSLECLAKKCSRNGRAWLRRSRGVEWTNTELDGVIELTALLAPEIKPQQYVDCHT